VYPEPLHQATQQCMGALKIKQTIKNGLKNIKIFWDEYQSHIDAFYDSTPPPKKHINWRQEVFIDQHSKEMDSIKQISMTGNVFVFKHESLGNMVEAFRLTPSVLIKDGRDVSHDVSPQWIFLKYKQTELRYQKQFAGRT
jgi:hypothetical protein